jgi:hypothetical protein
MSEGILDQVSVGIESTVGTAVTPTASMAVLPSDGVVTEQEAVGVEGINTSPAKNKGFVSGLRSYSGKFEMNAYPVAIGYILNSALGLDTPAAVASETLVKKHVFTETVTKPSYTLEQKIGLITERFAGFVASGFDLSFTVGEAVKFSFEGKALSEASATAISAAFETSRVFDWTDVSAITLGGTDIKAAVQSLKISYKNGLYTVPGLSGNADPVAQSVGNSEATASISAYMTQDMADQKAAFKAGTEKALVITLVADEVIGNGSYNTLTITLPRVAINTFSSPIDTNYVSVDAELVGAQDATNGLIKVELTNLVLDY